MASPLGKACNLMGFTLRHLAVHLRHSQLDSAVRARLLELQRSALVLLRQQLDNKPLITSSAVRVSGRCSTKSTPTAGIPDASSTKVRPKPPDPGGAHRSRSHTKGTVSRLVKQFEGKTAIVPTTSSSLPQSVSTGTEDLSVTSLAGRLDFHDAPFQKMVSLLEKIQSQ
eukprot:582783-Prorocentrum_lima.AAC.1